MNDTDEFQGYSRKKSALMVFPHFQMKLVGLALAASLGTVMILGVGFYFLVFMPFNRVLERSGTNSETQIQLMSNLSDSFWFLFFLGVAFSVMMLIFSLVLSHRVAGPIYQINKALDAFFSGDGHSRVVFRRGDEFVFLSDKVNRLMDEHPSSQNTEKAKLKRG